MVFLNVKNYAKSNVVSRWLDAKATNLLVGALGSGILPKHVAFIMDGNRRYAKNNGLEVSKGHEAGSASLVQIIDACEKLSIKYVSVYAFSIENFNRSKKEVDTLFEILVDKLNFFLDNSKDYNKLVQIRIIGNKSYIPEETLVKLEEIEGLTSKNNDLILNVCFAYTSRDEITHAIGKTVDKVRQDLITPNQIDTQEIINNFYFPEDTAPVDILIRTSGHTRLSDFLIWQVNEGEHTTIEFTNIYWPDFTALQYYFILLKWGFEKSIYSKIMNWKDFTKFGVEEYVSIKPSLDELPPPPPLVSILGTK